MKLVAFGLLVLGLFAVQAPAANAAACAAGAYHAGCVGPRGAVNRCYGYHVAAVVGPRGAATVTIAPAFASAAEAGRRGDALRLQAVLGAGRRSFCYRAARRFDRVPCGAVFVRRSGPGRFGEALTGSRSRAGAGIGSGH